MVDLGQKKVSLCSPFFIAPLCIAYNSCQPTVASATLYFDI